MKIKPLILSLVLLTAPAFSACGSDKESSQSTETTVTTVSAPKQGSFDIEYVRKQIILKGQPFEVPTPLKDLPGGWTWEESENSRYAADGSGLAYLYYNGEKIIVAGLENYFEGAKDDGIIYNFSFKTEDFSVDGFTPKKATKAEVVQKYGEPNGTKMSQSTQIYYYGTTNNNSRPSGRTNEQCLAIGFDEADNVEFISITYADLTKEH